MSNDLNRKFTLYDIYDYIYCIINYSKKKCSAFFNGWMKTKQHLRSIFLIRLKSVTHGSIGPHKSSQDKFIVPKFSRTYLNCISYLSLSLLSIIEQMWHIVCDMIFNLILVFYFKNVSSVTFKIRLIRFIYPLFGHHIQVLTSHLNGWIQFWRKSFPTHFTNHFRIFFKVCIILQTIFKPFGFEWFKNEPFFTIY